MVIAKCIYLPVTYNTKEGYGDGRKKKKAYNIFFFFCYSMLFAFICLSVHSF